MAINFLEIPADNLVPMFMTEIDNSGAAKSGPMPWKNLIIGQPLSSKNAGTKVTQIFDDASADALYGAGSQLALMIRAFRKNAGSMELYALPVNDKADSTKASGKITVTVSGTDSTPTLAPASGVLRIRIGGQSLPVGVKIGDTAHDIAAEICEAVNEKSNLAVTATCADASADVVLAAKNAGLCGNDIDIRFNHSYGEEFPNGVSLSRTAMANGGVDPVYESAGIAALIVGVWYNGIAIGSNDEDNVDYMKSILDERWTATVQQTGVLYFCKSGTVTETATAAKKYNSQMFEFPAIVGIPTPPFETAAAVLGAIAPIALNDPAVPLSNWPVKGVIAPKPEDAPILAEQNALLKAGAALLSSGSDGTVYLKRMVTTYKRNSAGVSDTSYQQLEKVHTLSFLRWDWNNYLAGKYPHHKLADDGNSFGPDQKVMTPSLGKAEVLTRYQYWMKLGLVQNFDAFRDNVVVERDAVDDTALCFLIPADLIDQLLICKSKLQFK